MEGSRIDHCSHPRRCYYHISFPIPHKNQRPMRLVCVHLDDTPINDCLIIVGCGQDAVF
jgi:hypothetical protein